MKTKAFVLLLVAVMVLGGSLGGAFAGGVALGKSQGQKEARSTQTAPSTTGSGQTQGQFTQEQFQQLQQLRQQNQGQLSQEQLQQLRQQFQGQDGQGASQGLPGGRGGLTGTIEKIEDNTVTVNTAQGPLRATVGADTTIQMSVAGKLQDLKTGLRVTVVGQRGEDGTVTARSVLITPAGADGFLGGGSNPGGSQ